LTPEVSLIEICKARVRFDPQQVHGFIAERTFGKPEGRLP
jgi:hypothetical protein